jgi:hypothetical protein
MLTPPLHDFQVIFGWRYINMAFNVLAETREKGRKANARVDEIIVPFTQLNG